jgi:hypothetical protein
MSPDRLGANVRGRPRHVAGTVTASVLTLGLWGAWYHFIAFREVDHQNGRRHSALFFLGFIPLLGIVFGLLYLRDELKRLHQDRITLGLDPGVPFETVLLWSILGAFILVGPFIALAKVMHMVNGYWREVYRRQGVAWPLRD